MDFLTLFLMRAVTNGGPDGSRLYSPGEMAFVSGIMLESLLFQQKVASGGAHSCALESPSSVEGSRVLCWGSRTYGQLGQGQIISDILKSPFNFSTLVLSESSSDNLYLKGITQVVAGREHSCVLSINEKVFCWGSGASHRLGNSEVANSPIPMKVIGEEG